MIQSIFNRLLKIVVVLGLTAALGRSAVGQGTRIDNYNGVAVKGQCAVFVQNYVEKMWGITKPIASHDGGAHWFWDDTPAPLKSAQKIANNGSNCPQAQDMLVWSGNFPNSHGYGHTGMVDSASDCNHIVVVDSNWQGDERGLRHTVNLSYVLGWYRAANATKGPSLTDNRMYREASHPEIYLAIGTGLMWIHTGNDVMYWGGWGAITVVPDGSLHVNSPGKLPQSGQGNWVMLKERNDASVYLVWDDGTGQPLNHLLTENAVNRYGGWGRMRIVPDQSLSSYKRGPDIR